MRRNARVSMTARRGWRTVLLASMAYAASSIAGASSFVERPWPTTFEAAEVVAFARVSAIETVERDGAVWTVATLDVDRWIVGDDDARARIGVEPIGSEDANSGRVDRWSIEFLGGATVGGVVDVVDDLPVPVEGSTVLVMAYAETSRATTVVGGWQGWFTVTSRGFEDVLGRRLVVTPDGVGLRTVDADDDASESFDLLEILDALDEGLLEAERRPGGAEGASVPSGLGGSEVADDRQAPDLAAPETTLVISTVDERIAEAVQRAVAAWNDVGVPLVATPAEEGDLRFGRGEAGWFGRDVLTLSRRAPGSRGVDVLLAPGPTSLRADVLGYEIARQLLMPRGTSAGWQAGLMPATGPDERTATEVAALVGAIARRPGDVDGDGFVGFLDLVEVGETFGTTGTSLAADVDRSGTVDADDVAFVLENYTFEEPSRDPPPGRTSVPR